MEHLHSDIISWDFTEPLTFLALTAFMFSVVVLRYFILAGAFYSFFYLYKPEAWAKRKINIQAHHKGQFWYELKYSLITSLIFALVGSLTAIAWQKGFTAIYIDINDMPLIWLPLSLIIAMFIHESYYYWLHRWMHQPKIYRRIHKVHHNSIITSPWTAFSFHPIEGLLEALILPAIVFLLPMHPYVLLAHLSIMTITSVINHLDIEIYPEGSHKHWFGKNWIGASHHSLHHQKFTCNYGLYFTLWDRWMKTESDLYPKRFEEKTQGKT
jgi:lathosterol oxidase